MLPKASGSPWHRSSSRAKGGKRVGSVLGYVRASAGPTRVTVPSAAHAFLRLRWYFSDQVTRIVCGMCVCVNWISMQLTHRFLLLAGSRILCSNVLLPADIKGVTSPRPPSSICLLRQTAVISSPRSFFSAPEALALSIPLSFSLLTPGLILGLNYVWLTLAWRRGNFVFVLSRQEGSCWYHHFLFTAKREPDAYVVRLLVGKLLSLSCLLLLSSLLEASRSVCCPFFRLDPLFWVPNKAQSYHPQPPGMAGYSFFV